MSILHILVMLGAALATRAEVPDPAPGEKPKHRELKHRADDPVLGIRWAPSFEEAMGRARRENKPVFLAFSVRRLADPESPYL